MAHGLGLIELMIAVTIGLRAHRRRHSAALSTVGKRIVTHSGVGAAAMASGKPTLWTRMSQRVRVPAGDWGKPATRVIRDVVEQAIHLLHNCTSHRQRRRTVLQAGTRTRNEVSRALTIPTQAIKTPAFRITVIKLTPTYWWFGMSTQPRMRGCRFSSKRTVYTSEPIPTVQRCLSARYRRVVL